MPARWILAKQMKIKRARKLSLFRKASGIDTGKIAAHELFQNKNRVSTIQGKSGSNLPVLDNTWTKEIPETIARVDNMFTWDEETNSETFSHLHNLNTLRNAEKRERDHLLDKLKSFWQGSWKHQGMTTWNTVVMKDGGGSKLVLYFSGNTFLFVLETPTFRFISKEYAGRHEAMLAYHSRISWMEKEPK